MSKAQGHFLHRFAVVVLALEPSLSRRQRRVRGTIQVASLSGRAPVAMHFHMLRDIVENAFVRLATLNDGKDLLLVLREYWHVTRTPTFPFLHVNHEPTILLPVHVSYCLLYTSDAADE